jgi:hypothetical protein
MIPSKIRPASAEPSQQRNGLDELLDNGAHSPMSQQGAGASHGHEMHPQKLVRLVGCHDLNLAKQEGADRRH